MSDVPADDSAEMWTPQAREAYLARVEALIGDLRRHARLVAALEQTHVDHDPDTRQTMWTSQDMLQRAVNAANDAEFDWSGSSSLPWADLGDDEDDVPDVPLDEDESELIASQSVISLVGRADFRIVDPEAFIAAGRRAYLRLYDLDDEELAARNVTTPLEAARALLEAPGFAELEVPRASEAFGAAWTYIAHEGSDDWISDPDPFSIARSDDEDED